MSEKGTALPGYAPEDLLAILDINHLQITSDASAVLRKGHTLPAADVRCAAHMVSEPKVKELLSSPSPGVIVVDGHFDPTQMGKISPLSYTCAMLSQALRQKSQQYAATFGSRSPVSMSAEPETGVFRDIVLEYFCALHTSDSDDLRGPQGLMRCLTTQLILCMVANEWIGQVDALHLTHLRNGEDELLEQRNLEAICRLFTALLRLVPQGVSVHCLVDGWSAYERDELWRAEYEIVLNGFREAADAPNPYFKLILTSRTSSRWLGDFVSSKQRISLRNGDAGKGNWRGPSRASLMGLARAATISDIHRGFNGGFMEDEHSEVGNGGGYDRRSSS